MFRCEVCEEVVDPGTPLHRVPTGYRVRRYRQRSDAFHVSVPYKTKPVTRDDPGGIGFEWKGMLKACPECFARYEEEFREDAIDKVEERVEAIAAK